MTLSPYPVYKDSGLPWLGQVPEHWEILRSGSVFLEVVDTEHSDLELLSIRSKVGIVLQSSTGRKVRASENRSAYKRIKPGFLGYNLMNAFFGGIGISSHEGILSPAYAVARPKFEIDSKYFHYLYQSPEYLAQFNRESYGIMYERNRLYFDRFKRIPVPLPPITEQTAIANFLYAHGRRTAHLIRNKRRMLKLVSEILNVVTHEVLSSPETQKHRLGAVADLIERPINRKNGDVYTPIGLFNRGRGIFHKEKTIGEELGDSTFFWIEEGDLIFSGQFAWEGAIALAKPKDAGCIASHRYPIFRGKSGIAESAYLLSFFRTEMGDLILNHHSRGAAGRNRPLNSRTLMKEKIPIPAIEEQQRVVEVLNWEYEVRRDVAQYEMRVNEYRERLIADVVTGKLDVRDVAVTMPDADEVLEDLEEENGDDLLEGDAELEEVEE